MIFETVNNNIKAKGGVSHTSTLDDAHIKKAIKHYVDVTGTPEKEVVDKLQKEMDSFEDVRAKSPILYDSIAGNIIEQTLYKMFREDEIDVKDAPKFNPVTFSLLVRKIKAENKSFFPLRNFFNKKPLISPRLVLVPSSDPADEKFNSIDTAAATPNGEFIFNTECMQRDMNFAHIQGVKPKSKKYHCNGGPIPDCWAPVEFTIMHEFYHYTHGDFHYGKVMGGDPTIHNWVGDFRSNYDLMKAGHHPYAEGLFNDNVNYDKQMSYAEMYKIVEAEFKKLNPGQQNKVKNFMNANGDDHSHHDSQDGPKDGSETPSEGDLEGHGKKVSKNAGAGEDGAEPDKPGPSSDKQASSGGRSDGGKNGNRTAVDYSNIRPKFNWKSLIDKLLHSSDNIETTYQKMHKRNITSMDLAMTTGAAAVRPGEKIVPANLVKLCLVVDSSGSMAEHIAKVFANIKVSLKTSGVAKSFIYCEFSDSFTFYKCTVTGNGASAQKMHKCTDDKGYGEVLQLNNLLAHESGGTNFTKTLTTQLKELIKMKYNVVVFSDSDLVRGENFKEMVDLYSSAHHQVGMVLDSKETFTQMISQMKNCPSTFSHF